MPDRVLRPTMARQADPLTDAAQQRKKPPDANVEGLFV